MTGHLPGLAKLIHDWSLTWVHIYMTGHLPGLATLIHDWSLTWVGYTYT
jgi:predicted transcriptional regulator